MDYKKLTKEYLDKYSKQESIEVVYRPHERMSWGKNRKIYNPSDKNCMNLHYNHRSILSNEVVFDFDEGNIPQNYIDVTKKLKEYNINYRTFWTKGSTKEGIRMNTFWNFSNVKDASLMKKIILKHFAYGKGIDYQLCGKHLIRAEYGFYEKEYSKQVYNVFKEEFKVNNSPSTIPYVCWAKYTEYKKNEAVRNYATVTGVSIKDEMVDKLLNAKIHVEDGRERILFYLIHQLKTKYDAKKVGDVLINWYHYNGGCKLTPYLIRRKVKYHWLKSYTFREHYLETLLGLTE